MNNKKIREKYLGRANKGVERLLSVVKDLDLIAKLESADLHLNKEPFNILELIGNTFELLEMKAKKRNITLRFDKPYKYPIMAVGDIERIEQVLFSGDYLTKGTAAASSARAVHDRTKFDALVTTTLQR